MPLTKILAYRVGEGGGGVGLGITTFQLVANCSGRCELCLG